MLICTRQSIIKKNKINKPPTQKPPSYPTHTHPHTQPPQNRHPHTSPAVAFARSSATCRVLRNVSMVPATADSISTWESCKSQIPNPKARGVGGVRGTYSFVAFALSQFTRDHACIASLSRRMMRYSRILLHDIHFLSRKMEYHRRSVL